MSGHKGPIGKYISGEMSKSEFIAYLKSGSSEAPAESGRKSTLSLEEDGDGVLDEGMEFTYARAVGDISAEEYAEFFNAMG